MYRRVIVVAVLLIAIGGAGYYFIFRKPQLVRVSTATIAPVSEVVYATGTVEPVEWAKVVPLQRRRVVELCHCEGQKVTKGQILGRQDDSEESAGLKELDVRYQQLIRDRDRAEKDDLPKAEREHRETAVQEMASRINAQKSRMETLVLRAPMDGVVLQRDGEIGEIAGPTDVLFWVGKPSPLQIVAEVNEDEITKIKVGQKAFLSSEAFANESLAASVLRITPKADPVKKIFRVYLILPNDTPLRTGMTVESNIIYREKPAATVVPLDAVAGDAVQVVSGDRVRRVPITTGVRGAQYVEVIGDISAGDVVLSPARNDVADAARVRVDGAAKGVTPAGGPEKGGTATAARDGQAGNREASVDAAISAVLQAHIQSLVSDARRSGSRNP